MEFGSKIKIATQTTKVTTVKAILTGETTLSIRRGGDELSGTEE